MSLQPFEDEIVPRVDWSSGHTASHHRSRRQSPTLHLHAVSLDATPRQLGVVAD